MMIQSTLIVLPDSGISYNNGQHRWYLLSEATPYGGHKQKKLLLLPDFPQNYLLNYIKVFYKKYIFDQRISNILENLSINTNFVSYDFFICWIDLSRGVYEQSGNTAHICKSFGFHVVSGL